MAPEQATPTRDHPSADPGPGVVSHECQGGVARGTQVRRSALSAISAGPDTGLWRERRNALSVRDTPLAIMEGDRLVGPLAKGSLPGRTDVA